VTGNAGTHDSGTQNNHFFNVSFHMEKLVSYATILIEDSTSFHILLQWQLKKYVKSGQEFCGNFFDF
jgi:hypothetical protein